MTSRPLKALRIPSAKRRSRDLPDVVKRVVIDASLKWEIRDKLDQMNLTERVICPGLDGLSQWLKRWYSSANPKPAPGAPGVPPKKLTKNRRARPTE
jgi:hypothetical protein